MRLSVLWLVLWLVRLSVWLSVRLSVLWPAMSVAAVPPRAGSGAASACSGSRLLRLSLVPALACPGIRLSRHLFAPDGAVQRSLRSGPRMFFRIRQPLFSLRLLLFAYFFYLCVLLSVMLRKTIK